MTTTNAPAVGRPLAVGYTLTTTAGAMLLEHGGTLITTAGLILIALGVALLAAIAAELAPAGPVAVAGGTLAIVLLAAACSAFVPWALWPGLVVLACHGLAAAGFTVIIVRHRRTAEEA